MLTAEQLRNTYPHKQMRMYIEREYPQAGPIERGQKLAALTRKFLRNRNEQDGRDVVPQNVDMAFVWDQTPEGFEFWDDINEMKPMAEPVEPMFAGGWGAVPAEVVPKAKRAKAALVVAKRKVGWW